MSQRIYGDDKTDQLIESDILQSKEGDFIVFGAYDHVEDKFTRVPKGIEICILSNDQYYITEALVKELKAQNAIHSLGYYKDEKWNSVVPTVYKEGDMVPNYIMKMFPQGMISQIGSSHIQGITKKMSLNNLWIHMQSASDHKNIIRCFWTANKLTNPVLHPKLLFHITKSKKY
ncbi:hypothetical protein [Flammeovirga sp. SJP92]|uniref:hypothetical protein n=1 Tax=Flammeovirga sp. SJP92 TaxID=1775430 RepID=UPI0007893E0F|nr:hypothetical protein [Flammeovirga sp. SJP92]KXX68076.1 hypothetical protein AVL50_23670 [Flammeovirga sp. SJP92]